MAILITEMQCSGQFKFCFLLRLTQSYCDMLDKIILLKQLSLLAMRVLYGLMIVQRLDLLARLRREVKLAQERSLKESPGSAMLETVSLRGIP